MIKAFFKAGFDTLHPAPEGRRAVLLHFGVPVLLFWFYAALSYIDTGFAFALCTFWIVVLAVLDKKIALALAMALVPFGQIFAFSPHDFNLLSSIALGSAALCYLLFFLQNRQALSLRDSRATRIFAAYCVLVIAHFQQLADKELLGAGLLLVTLIVLCTARYSALYSPQVVRLCSGVMAGGVFAAALFSTLYLYTPLPWLIATAPTPDNLRLLGVFTGINAGARFLLIPFCFFLVRALTSPKLRSWWLLLLLLTTLFIATTETKSAIGSSLLVCVGAFFVTPQELKKRLRVLVALVVALLSLWLLKLGPVIDYEAANSWHKISKEKLNYYLEKPPEKITVSDALYTGLRIGKSAEMKVNDKGKIEYNKQPYNLWATGQRDRIWKSGVETIMDYPLWGIGYKKWPDEMMKRISYPFMSPHNGLMEVAGAFGLIGAILYVLLTALIVGNFLKIRSNVRAGTFDAQLIWVTLASVAMFALETVDVSTSLAVTLSATWFWFLLGMQEGLLAKKPQA